MSMPALRFKDNHGQDFPEWELKELKQIAQKISTKNRDLLIKHVLTNSATQGIVSQSEYFDRDIANKNNLDGYYVVEMDDFVYNPRISVTAPVGPIKRNKVAKGVMSPLYTVFRFKEGCLNYYEQYFETTYWHDYLKSVANSGARHDRMNITNSDFLSLTVTLPSENEQTKIASFLTAVDEKITQLSQKYELLVLYKKGLIQQILSQELRFKGDDGQDFPDWTRTTLSNVAFIVMGSSPQSEAYNDNSNGLPLIQGNADIKARKSAPRIYTTQITKECIPSDILLSVRAPVGTVAISNHHACIGRGISAIRAKKEASQGFLYQWLLAYEPRWKSLSQGSTFEAVNSDDIKSLELAMPHIQEQEKIAAFLTAIDDKLTLTQNQLAAAKQYKQGLLQQMFV